MAYSLVLGSGFKDTTKTSATLISSGGDSVVISGTGFKYDANGYLKAGVITKMTYIDDGFTGPEKQQVVTLKNASAADLYQDLLSPAIGLIDKVDAWSTTSDVTTFTSRKIVLEMDDFSQVVITGSGFTEDPTKGKVTALQHLDVNGHNLEKIGGLHVSLSVAMTALGKSYDIYNYLTEGANTITNLANFPPSLEGGLGNDTLKGGSSPFAMAEYLHTATSGIHLDLATGKVTGGAGTDRLIDITSVSGSNFNDVMNGKNNTGNFFGDTLRGNGGNDTINGLGGMDYLYGGAGNDTIDGGKDDDHIDGGAGNDKIDGGAGKNDLITFSGGEALSLSGVTIDLSKTGAQDFGAWGKDTIKNIEGVYGSDGRDRITGNNGDNLLVGGGGSDIVAGMGGNDTLYGQIGPSGYYTNYIGNDTLNGGAGNDIIYASQGEDLLIGGAGKDTFMFATIPSDFSGPDVDRIKDFVSKDDTIKLSTDYFDHIGVGTISKNEFVLGTDAKDDNDYLIYDKSTGNLYFDADGNGAEDKVLFAVIVDKSVVTFTDIAGY